MRLACLTILASFAALAAAREDAAASLPVDGDELYFGELPVVLSATRLRAPVADSPVAVTIIDREMIEASGAREIADILRLVPGFLVGSLDGHQRTVGYHGLMDSFSRRMQVLVDGRSVYVPIFGGVRWSDLPLALEDIERVEVVRGPNSATYGSNSFLGVISFVTRHASEQQSRFAKLTLGTDDVREVLVRGGARSGNLDYRVTAKYAQDSGFEGEADDKQTSLLTLRADYQLDNRDSLELHAGATWGPREDGSEGSSTNPKRDIDATSYFLQGRWRRSLGLGEEISLLAYYSSFRSDDSFLAFAPPFQATVNFDRENRRADVEFQHTLRPRPDLRLAWGLEARRDEAIGARIFTTQPKSHNDLWRAFADAEWQLTPDWLLHLGLMAEDTDLAGTQLAPRIGLTHRFDQDHSLRLTASRATRTPAFLEARADVVTFVSLGAGPPVAFVQDLLQTTPVDAEEIESIELGYHFRSPHGTLEGDLKLFREKLTKLMGTRCAPLGNRFGLPPAPGLSVCTDPLLGPPAIDPGSEFFENGDRAKIRGLEVQLDWRPTARDRLFLGGALLDADASDRLENFSDSVPEYIYNLLWIHRLDADTTTSLALYGVDNMNYLEDGDEVEELRRLDFRVAQGLRALGQPAELALVFQNLLDPYADFELQNIFRRRVYVSFSMRLP